VILYGFIYTLWVVYYGNFARNLNQEPTVTRQISLSLRAWARNANH